jgi:CheY-like chemotaxis protein
MPQSVYRILLVEDSDDYALVMTRGIHRSTGFQLVWRAKDGLEAIKYLGASGEYGNREKFPMPDVMLLDLQMPRKDGWEVLEWLKDQPVKPIVVVLTILENPASRKKALGLGADEFQVKPYDEDGLKQFLTWLKDLVREARQRTA